VAWPRSGPAAAPGGRLGTVDPRSCGAAADVVAVGHQRPDDVVQVHPFTVGGQRGRQVARRAEEIAEQRVGVPVGPCGGSVEPCPDGCGRGGPRLGLGLGLGSGAPGDRAVDGMHTGGGVQVRLGRPGLGMVRPGPRTGKVGRRGSPRRGRGRLRPCPLRASRSMRASTTRRANVGLPRMKSIRMPFAAGEAQLGCSRKKHPGGSLTSQYRAIGLLSCIYTSQPVTSNLGRLRSRVPRMCPEGQAGNQAARTLTRCATVRSVPRWSER
jgi:hypothetical protein